MPDRETISRVAAILAKATSPEPAEAAASIRGAYKRMVRDGVTFPDLLTLPLVELYQESLVKLAELILAEQADLSLSAKREAFAEYMRLIVLRFSGDAGDTGSAGASSDNRAKEREAEVRRYEERRREQESERGRGGDASPPPPGTDEKPFSRQNTKTAERQYKPFNFDLAGRRFSFSPAAFFASVQMVFGRGSITWHGFHSPGRTLRLFAVAALYGFAFSGVLLSLAAALHALTGTGPLWDVKLKNAFAFLAAIGFMLKARQLFLAGWFR